MKIRLKREDNFISNELHIFNKFLEENRMRTLFILGFSLITLGTNQLLVLSQTQQSKNQIKIETIPDGEYF